MTLQAQIQRRWYGRAGSLRLLWPLEVIYRAVTGLRRTAYVRGWFKVWRPPVPVIVVGNISVGGTGKTPVTAALCEALRAAGWSPGIVSRGYGARPPQFPFAVSADGVAAECGDEPLLLARRNVGPVAIAPERAAAARYLLEHHRCDVLVCDDGLQHYALARDIEWAVVDGARGLGNRHCLPVGPLREPSARLATVDAVLINSEHAYARQPQNNQYWFRLEPTALVRVADGECADIGAWPAERRRVHAVAGIGNPQRFFASLRQLGFDIVEHAFPDHHPFTAQDLAFGDGLPVLMTEKDAVKCRALVDTEADTGAAARLWYLRVDARLPDSLLAAITGKLSAIGSAPESP